MIKTDKFLQIKFLLNWPWKWKNIKKVYPRHQYISTLAAGGSSVHHMHKVREIYGYVLHEFGFDIKPHSVRNKNSILPE